MKRILLTGVLLIIASTPALGQTRSRRPAGARISTEQRIRQLESDFIVARRQARMGNPIFLERLLSDDFIATSLNGRTVNKAQYVRISRNPNLRFSVFTPDDVTIRVYGNGAVVTGRMTATARPESGGRTFQFRYVRVYVKEGGRWQVAAIHLTHVVPA